MTLKTFVEELLIVLAILLVTIAGLSSADRLYAENHKGQESVGCQWYKKMGATDTDFYRQNCSTVKI